MLDVLVAGEIYTDLVLSGFPSWPRPGEESFASVYHREAGGGAAITACALARLGASAGVLAVAGHDGNWIADRLHAMGVDTTHLTFDPDEPTGVTVAVSDAHDRAFFSYLGANRRFPEMLATADWSQARHVHLAFPPDLDTAEELLAKGDSVSLDLGWHEDWLRDPRALALVAHLAIFFPNEREAAAMTGEQEPRRMLEAFREAGAKTVALKLGPAGAGLLYEGEILFDPAVIAKVVDTTGAGDCFDAGFLHAWLQRESPHACLHAGNVAGARSTEAMGGL